MKVNIALKIINRTIYKCYTYTPTVYEDKAWFGRPETLRKY